MILPNALAIVPSFRDCLTTGISKGHNASIPAVSTGNVGHRMADTQKVPFNETLLPRTAKHGTRESQSVKANEVSPVK